jgi:WD40 repeat protein/3',5'-cyclic AMP phosphodiesterase CpdA
VTVARPLLLLHLSDLHFGVHSRFIKEDLSARGRVFGRAIDEERRDLNIGSAIDLVIVTGDLAETGKPKEFKEAAEFLTALADAFKLDRRQFVFCPGNHDLSWTACRAAETAYEAECEKNNTTPDDSESRERMNQVKFCHYDDFLREFHQVPKLDDLRRDALGNNGWLYDFPDLRLSVAALNSCEVESHRSKDHYGSLGETQAQRLMDCWRIKPRSDWLKVIAVHHNPDGTVRANVEAWREGLQKGQIDDETILRYEADVVGFDDKQFLLHTVQDTEVQLVLHGHHHAMCERAWPWKRDGVAHVLSAGSLGLKPEKLPAEEPSHVRLIGLDPCSNPPMVRAYSLIYDPRARLDGQLLSGKFVRDPAEPKDGYSQSIRLPDGFLPSPELQRRRKTKKGTPRPGKAATVTPAVPTALPIPQGLFSMKYNPPVVPPGWRLRTLGPFPSRIFHSSWSPDGTWLALGFENGRVQICNPEDGQIVQDFAGQISVAQEALPVAWAPDGSQLAIGQRGDIQYFRVPGWKDVGRLRLVEPLFASVLAWSPDGEKLAAVDGGSQIRLLDTRGRRGLSLVSLRSTARINTIAWSPEGRQLAVGTAQGLKVIAAKDEDLEGATAFPHTASPVVWDPNGPAIICGGRDSVVRRIDPTSGRNDILVGNQDEVGEVYGLFLSRDGRLLGAKDRNGVSLWSCNKRQLVYRLPDPAISLFLHSALTADRTRPRFASLASHGNVINLWEYTPDVLLGVAPPGAPDAPITGHDFDVFLAHNSADKPAVETIGEKLHRRGLKPWLDKEQIPPGRWFQELIQQDIGRVRTAAIFIGPRGLGRWQKLELLASVSRCVEQGIPVIPVLLPGVADIPEELVFLRELNCVRFQSLDDAEALDKLVWGISGKRPRKRRRK